jgi:hypothetical protein
MAVEDYMGVDVFSRRSAIDLAGAPFCEKHAMPMRRDLTQLGTPMVCPACANIEWVLRLANDIRSEPR